MKKILLTFSLLLLAASASAAPVSPAQALHIAKNFWNSRATVPADKFQWNDLSAQTSFHHCYLFAVDTVGFVMVSADDRVSPILGYSFNNPISAEQMPAHFVAWMNDRQLEFDYLCQQQFPTPDSIQQEWKRLEAGGEMPKACPHEVRPLLKTTWSQWYPYNLFSPRNNGQECPSGCVATAMAQLMKYWNYPKFGRGERSIMAGTIVADFEHTQYAWNLMLNNYNRSHTPQQDTAVGLLMLHCAVAVDMVFTESSSSAVGYNYAGDTNYVCSPNGLRKYFRYAGDYLSVDLAQYTFSEINAMFRKELDARRPILYAGQTQTRHGHQFICDGYSSDGLFHYNWGWGGYLDGYFRTSYLYPEGNPEHFIESYSINKVTMNIRPAQRVHASVESMTLPRRQVDTTFTLFSSYDDSSSWQLVRCPQWASVSQSSGFGAGALTSLRLSVQANDDASLRSGEVVFLHGNDTARMKIYQYCSNPEDMCQLVVTAGDTYHNGWDGAYMLFYSPSGFEYGKAYTNATQSTFNIPVCSDSVYVAWMPGGTDNQCTYSVDNNLGTHFFEDTGAFYFPKLITNPCQMLACETIDSFPWLEDFEDALRLHCYRSVDLDGDGYFWTFGDPNFGNQGHAGSATAAVSSSYLNSVGALTPDNWLITPAIQLSDSAASRFSWWVASHNVYDFREHYSVLLSNTGTSISDFSHLLYEETLSQAGYQQRFASLADYQGQTVYIAFRHHNCSNQFWMSIDDLAIDFDAMPDTGYVAIAQIDASNWRVYPNPAHNQVSVSSANDEPFCVALFNSVGQQVLVDNTASAVHHAGAMTHLDVSSLPAGVYILRITSSSATLVRRVVVE